MWLRVTSKHYCGSTCFHCERANICLPHLVNLRAYHLLAWYSLLIKHIGIRVLPNVLGANGPGIGWLWYLGYADWLLADRGVVEERGAALVRLLDLVLILKGARHLHPLLSVLLDGSVQWSLLLVFAHFKFLTCTCCPWTLSSHTSWFLRQFRLPCLFIFLMTLCNILFYAYIALFFNRVNGPSLFMIL